jgi:DNA-binding MarR family transcriptional regulator
MVATALGERASPAATRSRTRRTSARSERVERAEGAKVDLGCLPRLLGYTLRRAHLASWRQYVAVIGEQKLRPGLFSLMVLVGSNPGIAQIELGTHLGIDKASIVALLDRLEKAGLLERCRSVRDRRRQGIFLTNKGSAELETLIVQVRSLERQMAARFTRAEMEQLLGLLQRLYA